MAKLSLITKPHLHWPQQHLRPRVFCLKAQHDAFLGLDRHDESRRVPIEGCLSGKRLMRHRAELNRDFRNLPGQALARAKIERHVLPAPVVHEQL